MNLAIIPARGGSKGIPQKNIHLFNGKPLIVHSIEQALATKSIDKVIVSTDADDIRKIALRAGAEVITRPIGISGDDASSESAIIHVLDSIKYRPDTVIFLQATSPIRFPDDIQGAINLFNLKGADSLFSSVKLECFVWNMSTLRHWIEPTPRVMRQAMPRMVLENGSIYIFKPSILYKHNSRLGGYVIDYPMHPLTQFQIDEPEDLKLLESISGILQT